MHSSRYIKINPADREEFVAYLKQVKKLDEAAVLLAELVNDEGFVSQQGKSRHDLWTELLQLIVRNPAAVRSLNVDAIIRSGIRRFPHEVRLGLVWVCWLVGGWVEKRGAGEGSGAEGRRGRARRQGGREAGRKRNAERERDGDYFFACFHISAGNIMQSIPPRGLSFVLLAGLLCVR